jgi:hypothetical protein
MSIGGEQLTPTDPYGGLIAMSIFALFLLAGYFKWLKTYQLLMLIAILLLGYGGVVKNIFALISTPELYYSMGVGIFGMLINLYGLVLNIIAALGKFVVD